MPDKIKPTTLTWQDENLTKFFSRTGANKMVLVVIPNPSVPSFSLIMTGYSWIRREWNECGVGEEEV